MTKSTITREQLTEELKRRISVTERYPDLETAQIDAIICKMALAAMDSEPVEMPLDYLQGHKDALEWAAKLAEANHPETGDWLYDDPIELAKAIRKGPDMPPVQPVADSETDRNPVLAYADSYRDMAKQGVESVPIWIVITDLERNIAPRYRHAQPAPVVPEEIDAIISKAVNGVMSTYSDSAEECRFMVREHISQACRAAMLNHYPDAVNMDHSGDATEKVSSPVIPDGLLTVCAEAYQVVGVMAEALGVFDDAAVQKVMDNLAQQKLVHCDVLPFSLPAVPKQEATSARVHPARD
nr:hypothetical protein [Pluralibacter gergoviae]